MLNSNFKIKPYSDFYRPQILSVWEKSVLATHQFLSPNDFEEIKILVSNIDFNEFQVFCLVDDDLVAGFVGVTDQKVEMLFLHPQFFGKGLGRMLLEFAVHNLDASQLDVNEQNGKALEFYQKFGFKTFERTDRDDQGRNYPLLKMKLSK